MRKSSSDKDLYLEYIKSFWNGIITETTQFTYGEIFVHFIKEDLQTTNKDTKDCVTLFLGEGGTNENHNGILLHTHHKGWKEKDRPHRELARIWENWNESLHAAGRQSDVTAFANILAFS